MNTLYDYYDIQYLQIKLKNSHLSRNSSVITMGKFMLNLYSKTLKRGFPPLSKLDGEV